MKEGNSILVLFASLFMGFQAFVDTGALTPIKRSNTSNDVVKRLNEPSLLKVKRKVPKSIKASSCVNNHKLCGYWYLIGDCTKRVAFMETTCRRACSLCRDELQVLISECVDVTTRCQYWSRMGKCRTNPGFMLRNCRVSCKVCPHQSSSAPPCVDNHVMCGFWYLIGRCARNAGYMETICPRSCGVCTGAENIPGYEDLGKLCQEWESQDVCYTDPEFMMENCKDSCCPVIPTTTPLATPLTTNPLANTLKTTHIANTTTSTPTTTTTAPPLRLCPSESQPSVSVAKRLLGGVIASPCKHSPGIVAITSTMLSSITCTGVMLSTSTVVVPSNRCFQYLFDTPSPVNDRTIYVGDGHQKFDLTKDYIEENTREEGRYLVLTLPHPVDIANCPQYACQYSATNMADRVDFNTCFIASFGGRSHLGSGWSSYEKRMLKLDIRFPMTEPCCDSLLDRVSEGFVPSTAWINDPGVEYVCLGTGGSTCDGDIGAPVYCTVKETSETILVGLVASAPCKPGELILAVDLTNGDIKRNLASR